MLSQKKTSEIKVFVRSKPISIKKKTENNNFPNNEIDFTNTLGDKKVDNKSDNTYKLDSICFDPTKFSPPDEWSIRLKNRIRNYHSSSYGYIDYLFDNK
tara:strand:- start:221 stop:517 length:297 start_codon:yes stop_codon:yes gene_type:complete